MTFDSQDFLIFFAVIFIAWFFIQNLERRIRNGFLLISSYFFYGYWSPAFVILIVISTLVDFYLAKAITQADNTKKKKQLVSVSVIVNLAILGFFKYFNFFIDSALIILPDGSFIAPAMEVILPIGISFYTFQSMSYSIDVYRGKIKPADSLLDFALYIAFFPQLVAGPIERARNMLPQFAQKPRVSVVRTLDGFDLCIRGYFKKVVIADNLAPLVNLVFGDVDSASGLSLWIATYAFAFQIYADFSGYSDIARGTAKLLGFELMVNFNSPYRSLSLTEFWQRWHISLSTWFRDYLYKPLRGKGRSKFIQLRAVFLVMALCGLWHGAAWNFVLFGLFHGILLFIHNASIPFLKVMKSKFNNIGKILFKFVSWFVTFHLVIISFVMFRAESIADIATAFEKMLVNPLSLYLSSGFSFIPNAGLGEQAFYIVIILGALLAQFSNFETKHSLSRNNIFRGARGALSLSLLFLLYPAVKEQFIYFQF